MNIRRKYLIRASYVLIIVLAGVCSLLLSVKFLLKTPKQASSSSSNKEAAALFIDHVMIRSGGLYTLLGSKPVTQFDIQHKTDETEEEIRTSYKQVKSYIESALQQRSHPIQERTAIVRENSVPTYAEYKKRQARLLKNQPAFNHKKLWREWTNKQRIYNPKYRIFSRKTPHNKHASMGLFVNIPNLAYTLHHYYHTFAERTGGAFNPADMAFCIDNETCPFWEKVFQDNVLLGLIFGYGDKNAYLFNFCLHYFPSEMNTFGKLPKARIIGDTITHADLTLPVFRQFHLGDSVLHNYECERKEILSYFEGKAFYETVLALLNGNNKRL